MFRMANEPKKTWEIDGLSEEQITPEAIFHHRRIFLKAALAAGVGATFPFAGYAAQLAALNEMLLTLGRSKDVRST